MSNDSIEAIVAEMREWRWSADRTPMRCMREWSDRLSALAPPDAIRAAEPKIYTKADAEALCAIAVAAATNGAYASNCERIEKRLMEHRLSYTHGDDGDAYPLVDRLVPDGETTIETGRKEIELLAENIADLFGKPAPPDAIRAAEPVACTNGVVLMWMPGHPKYTTSELVPLYPAPPSGAAGPIACLGVPDRKCNYLATCGEICNKCGRFHNPTGPLLDKLREAEANYDRGFRAGQRIPRNGECVESAGYPDRTCERGTRTCIVEHADTTPPSPPAHEHGQGWRPIESAPKDGRTVLCGRANVKPYIGRWDGANNEWVDYKSGYATWREPTHWQPLPEPPRD